MKVNIDPDVNKDLLIYILENLLDGTPPHLIDVQIEEESLFPVTIEDNDTFYHGTSEILGKVIEQTGLCTPRISGVESTHGAEISRDSIFITTNIDLAKEWSRNAAWADKSPPIILRIKGKDINESGCKAFVDALDFTAPATSIVLKECDCIKAERV